MYLRFLIPASIENQRNDAHNHRPKRHISFIIIVWGAMNSSIHGTKVTKVSSCLMLRAYGGMCLVYQHMRARVSLRAVAACVLCIQVRAVKHTIAERR